MGEPSASAGPGRLTASSDAPQASVTAQPGTLQLRPWFPTSSSANEAGAESRPAAPSSGASFECGIAAGFVTTALLNPWDRALYLSVVNERPFFARANWKEPYRGLTQTVAQRSISSGIYFPLEDLCSRSLGSHAWGGQAAGVLVGVVLNPLSLIKYQIWQEDEVRRSFRQTARRLLRDAGPLVFLRGIMSTGIRDGIFGLCFSLRKYLQAGKERQPVGDFAIAMVCAAAGTTLSSPFNYVRNMAYAHSTKADIESWQCKIRFWKTHLGALWQGAAQQESLVASASWLQKRMQLGWGTFRVGVGMALTDFLYQSCCRTF
eukprot:TRINITY_DN113459_c0_g1_i1.p1 TRINITY_DN113459_c0_g1~~TRINITY_DN113459_c0_g1_i1.p1  ORF type:complete len:339 (-),score=46.83 TRINITY_DN113459_c0_g1_i1:58-1014(-)